MSDGMAVFRNARPEILAETETVGLRNLLSLRLKPPNRGVDKDWRSLVIHTRSSSRY